MRRWIAVASSLALFGTLLGAAVQAGHRDPGDATKLLGVQPTQVDGNATCSSALGSNGFLFEHKFEPVGNVTGLPLSHGSLSGTLSIQKKGSTFDFAFTGDFVAGGVFVKAGADGNLYDYRPDHGPGAVADTYLHGPINPSNGKFYGLSHVSFCVAEGGAELEVEKAPDSGEVGYAIDPGGDASFTITVTNKGPAIATNVTIGDTLPAGLTWSTTETMCSITADSGGDVLACDVGDLAKDATFGVTVTATTSSAHCGTLDNPAAKADADNADDVSDAGQILVECGAIAITKTAKHADTSGQTWADLAAEFTIKNKTTGPELKVSTDEFSGKACVDGLAFGGYSVSETMVPTGYAAPSDQSVIVDTVASCSDATYFGAAVTVDNTPLTDVDITVNSLRDGATFTEITCTEVDGTKHTKSVSDGTLSMDALEPVVDPADAIVCTIYIDP